MGWEKNYLLLCRVTHFYQPNSPMWLYLFKMKKKRVGNKVLYYVTQIYIYIKHN